MPILSDEEEDSVVEQILGLLVRRGIAFISIQNILRKLQANIQDQVKRFEP